MYKTLLEKNGYLLVEVEEKEDGTKLYSYGSAEYMGEDRPLNIIGTKEYILKSCKKSLRACNRNKKKYVKKEESWTTVVIEFIEKQKEALQAFIKILESL